MTIDRSPQNSSSEEFSSRTKFLNNSGLQQSNNDNKTQQKYQQQVLHDKSIDVKNHEHQLKQLTSAIEDGKIRQAIKLERLLQNQIGTLPINLVNSLAIQTASLKALQDWQIYATNPKRQVLCEEMAKLAIDQRTSEVEKARLIKKLQDQWKNLGASDSKQAQVLWRKFKRLAEEAYKPCASYFKTQKQVRIKNQVEREKICSALEKLATDMQADIDNWQDNDWKNLSALIDDVQKEWRRFDEVPRSKYKALQQRYKTVLDILYGGISAEKSRNHQYKSTLIQTVANLVDQDLRLSEKVEKTKEIQGQWAKGGICERSVDQKLWKQFRVECDKVFALRSNAKNLVKQKTDNEAQRAEVILKALQDILEGDTAIDKSLFSQIRKDFRNISLDLRYKHLNVRFKELCKNIDTRFIEQKLVSQKYVLIEFKRKAKLCAIYELGEASLDSIMKTWYSDLDLPDNYQVALEERLNQSTDADIEVNIEAKIEKLEVLCIRLETLAKIESPVQSQQAKLAYQVERLNKELSEGQKEIRPVIEQIQEIQFLWYSQTICQQAKDIVNRFSFAENKLSAN